jgi:hypothetical protein
MTFTQAFAATLENLLNAKQTTENEEGVTVLKFNGVTVFILD